jgi:hypothetical protein
MNQMFLDVIILPSQKHGIIVCVPKSRRPVYPDDYRPLTLMNTDLKLLSHILANRLHPWLTSTPANTGIQGNNILGAVAAICEAVAQAEMTNTPMCIISLDFKVAFDHIAHSYLFVMLEAYRFNACFQRRLCQLYGNVASSVKINGYISSPMSINCSIHQGCPLSMLLFALCLDPFLRMLDDNLNGHRTAHHTRHIAVLVYADVTIILQSPHEVPLVREAIRTYEASSGTKLNLHKSKAMALGSSDMANTVMGLEYHTELRILGICFATTIRQSALTSWTHVTHNIRAQAQELYHRDLQLHHRIQYVSTFLMAKAWYTAQLFTLPKDSVQQINTAVSLFIWHGAIFWVPLSTIYKPKACGGWALIQRRQMPCPSPTPDPNTRKKERIPNGMLAEKNGVSTAPA